MGLRLSVNRDDAFLTAPHGLHSAQRQIGESLEGFIPVMQEKIPQMDGTRGWVVAHEYIWWLTTVPYLTAIVCAIVLLLLLGRAVTIVKRDGPAKNGKVTATLEYWEQEPAIWCTIVILSILPFLVGSLPKMVQCYVRRRKTGSMSSLYHSNSAKLKALSSNFKREPLNPALYNHIKQTFYRSIIDNGYMVAKPGDDIKTLDKAYEDNKDRQGGAWALLPVSISKYLYYQQMLAFTIQHFADVAQQVAEKEYTIVEFVNYLNGVADNAKKMNLFDGFVS